VPGAGYLVPGRLAPTADPGHQIPDTRPGHRRLLFALQYVSLCTFWLVDLRVVQGSFQLLDRRQAQLQVLRQRLGELVRRHADRLAHVAQGILDDHLVLAFAQDQADARLVVGVAQQVVEG